MKQASRVIATLLLSLFLSPTLNTSVAVANPQSDQIQSIRRQYTAINKRAGKYRRVNKELSGFSLEGGKLVAYFDGPAIVKIVATYYGESGRSLEEYYYTNEKLIFVFRKEFRYDTPLSGKVVHTYENRFYFADDRLIEWLNSQVRPAPNGIADYQQKQNEYLETSRKFVQGARSKGATIEA